MREHRMTWAAVERIAEGLSDRDRAVVADVARVKVLTSSQLERLHFQDLGEAHRGRARRRVLARLTSLSLLSLLERRIGGARAGSCGLVFALGPAGQRLLAMTPDNERSSLVRTRQPYTPTPRFLRHELAVSELYVRLVEQNRADVLDLLTFRAEPESWWQINGSAWVKPDAYAVVGRGTVEDAYAIEVDMATESRGTLRRKLLAYLSLADGPDDGPDRTGLPRVLVTAPDERRQREVRALVTDLPPPADQLFAVVTHDGAVDWIAQVLRE